MTEQALPTHIFLYTPTFDHNFLRNKFKEIDLTLPIVIDFSMEAHAFITHPPYVLIYDHLHEVINEFGVDPSLVTYVTCNAYEQENYDAYCTENKIIKRINILSIENFIYFQHSAQDMVFLNNLYRNKIKNKYFTCLNRVPRDHRLYLVNSVYKHNIQGKGYISALFDFGTKFNFEKINYPTEQDLIKQAPLIIDQTAVNLEWNPHSNTSFDDALVNVYKDSYIDLISETLIGPPSSNSCYATPYPWWKEMFLTEKTFRSIRNERPFFIVGNKHSLAHLQQLGFKTFSHIWDESYDSIDSNAERIDACVKSLKDFMSNNTLQQVHNIMYSDEVQDILRHNRATLLRLISEVTKIRKKFDPDTVKPHPKFDNNNRLAHSANIPLDTCTTPVINLVKADCESGYWVLADKIREQADAIRKADTCTINFSFEAISILFFNDVPVLIYDWLIDNIRKAGFEPHQFIYVSGNGGENRNYVLWHQQTDRDPAKAFKHVAGRETQLPATFYNEDLSYTTTSYSDIVKPLYALSMHRRAGTHRVWLCNEMQRRQLIDDSKIISKFNWDWHKQQSVLPSSELSLANLLPKNTPEDDMVCYSESYPPYYHKMYQDTYYSIETETQADIFLESEGAVLKELYPFWNRMYFTEKIWRNIAWKRPFLVLGDPGMLETLHSFGFKTFDGVLWDESYDKEPDWKKRCSMILDQHQYIMDSYTLTQLHNKIYSKEVQQILNENKMLLEYWATKHK